jgi:hypothetical protein
MSPNGRRLRERPASFGVEDHTHNVRVGAPWHFSFEETFNRADNAMGSVVDWLITLEAKRTDGGSFGDRLLGQAMNREQRDGLSECLASLVVRSPAMRNRIRRGVEHYRQRFGIADYEADKTLVAMNMRPLLDGFTRRLAQTGKFAVLFSEEREFTFGDGFLQSFPTNVPVYGGPKCIVPFTPTIAVLYCSPSQYMSNSLLATMRVNRSEVDHLNRLVQIYACECIFYRRDEPRLHQEFSDARHYELQHHSEPWSDALIDALAGFADKPAQAA